MSQQRMQYYVGISDVLLKNLLILSIRNELSDNEKRFELNFYTSSASFHDKHGIANITSMTILWKYNSLKQTIN